MQDAIMVDLNQPLVLVVDDISTVRVLLKDILQELGFERIEEATDGAEALAIMEKGRPSIIFSDYMMPNLDGLQFLKKVRENPEFSDIPFILISAVADKEIVNQAFALGLTKHFTKPIGFSQIQQCVVEFLAPTMK
jgi:two-component system chemotaxis response regulator CheY